MGLTRSQTMARIRGTDTAPEAALRVALEAHGLSHNRSTKTPVGVPDIVLQAEKVAIFIDGCFWHGCPLHYARPRTREDFWSGKLVTNLERDARISETLTQAGWMVVRVWEHEVVEDLDGVADRVEELVRARSGSSWPTQRRVRRVVETADRIERREYVLLGDPTAVVEGEEGQRVTAKARAKRR